MRRLRFTKTTRQGWARHVVAQWMQTEIAGSHDSSHNTRNHATVPATCAVKYGCQSTRSGRRRASSMAALAGFADLANSHPAGRTTVITSSFHRTRAGRVRTFHELSSLRSPSYRSGIANPRNAAICLNGSASTSVGLKTPLQRVSIHQFEPAHNHHVFVASCFWRPFAKAVPVVDSATCWVLRQSLEPSRVLV